ncbi:TPA: IS66 family transposase [Pseudomonas aeruginosa]|uniref:IS66 family transposase n=1 Tax=Pseudomonas aeruginosa TaxID=287 RepID=UPI000AF1ED1F|nr:IS66 family transposase [Pseudomonas aeruginosa]MBI8713332.1 IS66 family transposase [Pseudomonas aeruginosa]UGR35323.1 IS66 family transposase [Pseudomonas aeruginosa]VFT59681.1 protein TnpC1 [Pseudomonas aeruginosa]HCJ6525404.1 IS66 family transposase [Pseudomonas aeruginosa]HCL3373553.1 IS66 family transposase [Pseudomonas aeruginosa]
MLDVRDLQPQDLAGLTPEAIAQLAARMLGHIREQDERIGCQAREIEFKQAEIEFKDAKLRKITFELARLKRWKFAAKSEAMNAEQRRLFEETLAEDEASLRAQLEQLQGKAAASDGDDGGGTKNKRKPKRQALPADLPRVEHHHEPEDTNCPTSGCGRPMVRIGEDVSEELDIIPAQYFVHRHIYGKWACRCCQCLKQEPAEPRIVDGGIPAAGLVAHTLIARFVDHLPYYRQEAIAARSGVHTPRSTLAQWSGRGGAALEPLYELHKAFVLSSRVLHADETPVAMLDPGAGKTKRAYVWGYARGAFEETPGVIYEFCAGRGAQYPIAFLRADDRHGRRCWQGTLVRDEYAAYDSVVDANAWPHRIAAGCLAHARRKFDELVDASSVAQEAVQRVARIYRAERKFAAMTAAQRLSAREAIAKPLWDEMHLWLKLERGHVADGSAIAKAIDYSLSHWDTLTRNLHDGEVPVDNNHLENQILPGQRVARRGCSPEVSSPASARRSS